jgi:hypothetical protein
LFRFPNRTHPVYQYRMLNPKHLSALKSDKYWWSQYMCDVLIFNTSKQHYTLYQHPLKLVSKHLNLHQKYSNTIQIRWIGCFRSREHFLDFTFLECWSVFFWDSTFCPTMNSITIYQHYQLVSVSQQDPSRIPVSNAESESSVWNRIRQVLVESIYVWCASFLHFEAALHTISASFEIRFKDFKLAS